MRDDEDYEEEEEAGVEDTDFGGEERGGGGYSMNFRMYENQFPEIDEVVVVQVRSIAEMGAYVSLLEYNNIEGMILLSELSRRRIRSINKLVRVGKQEVCMVLRVDKEKGYIDLSKRRVSPEDVQKCDERYQRSKAVHSIVRHVSEVVHVDMEQLYQKTAWPLYRKYGHAYEAFRLAITDPDSIFNDETMPDLDPAWRKAMLADIAKRLTPTAVKVDFADWPLCIRLFMRDVLGLVAENAVQSRSCAHTFACEIAHESCVRERTGRMVKFATERRTDPRACE
eukprot:1397951-Pleurochrysis_carterae.AAC.9